MKENKVSTKIDRPISEVFEFTTNPNNTPLWIDGLIEEQRDTSPTKIGTEYRNCDESGVWDTYYVTEYEKDKIFTLQKSDKNYNVRYTYKSLNDNKTEMEYFEWVDQGELENPFTQEVLEKLKAVIEQ